MSEVRMEQDLRIERDGRELKGYAGKILRINLTDSTTEVIPSSKYLPKYIGGRTLCHRIFWDEVGPGVGAFDPGNKLIFAAGPTTGTGVPTGGRAVMTGIAPSSLPEQYSYGSIGGWCATYMKYAGYDAIILEGKAPRHTYIMIEDDVVTFKDAEEAWGMLVHDTQQYIREKEGDRVFSLVIGPAGENLCRNATITTNMDHAFSKNGFGAVFGSKNLKAIAIKGSGEVVPGDIDKILKLRRKVGYPELIPNPPEKRATMCGGQDMFEHDWTCGKFVCSPGCNQRCQPTIMGTTSVFNGERIDQIEKCVSPYFANMKYDIDFPVWLFVSGKKNNWHMGQMKSFPKPMDDTDPDWDILSKEMTKGDKLDFYGPSFDRCVVMNQLSNEYGLDKWDIGVWFFSWIAMAKHEGLLDDLDFGMEPDVDSLEFIRHFMDILTYRKGIGDIFAEGMARAMRKLGKEKYGDAIYHGRTSYDGRPLELPVSVETGWGQCMHWTGRGYQGTPKWLWLSNSLTLMCSTRDAICSAHMHVSPDDVRKFYDEGPSTSQTLINDTITNEVQSVMKDSVTTCEWVVPDIYWPTLEVELFNAATGDDSFTKEDLYHASDRGRLLFRAILMRNHDRCRDMEVPEVFPNMTYPDPRGEVAEWDEWNEFVNMYYKTNGWDLNTGWPLRETWEKYDLKDIADEMEKAGKLPDGSKPYEKRESPFEGRKRVR